MATSRYRTALLAILTAPAMLALTTSPAHAQAKYSDATYITASQFLAQLKEVSLDLVTDSSLTRLIPMNDQQDMVAKALAARGITVRPNSPVTLEARVTHTRDTIYSRNRDTDQLDETTVVQGIYIGVKFMVRAAAWRNGLLHWVDAAPAVGWSGSTQAEDTDLRKMLLGDQTVQDIRNRFARLFDESLQGIAADTNSDVDPWPVNSWTAATKAAVDADYARHRTTGQLDVTALRGINTTPGITLAPNFNHESCKTIPAWSSSWSKGFADLHWTAKPGPTVGLVHFVSCVYAYGMAAPRYFALTDRFNLYERNLVFELNGKTYRRWSSIFSSHHEMFAIEENIDDLWPTFIPQCIADELKGIEIWQVAAGGPGEDPLPAPSEAAASPRFDYRARPGVKVRHLPTGTSPR